MSHQRDIKNGIHPRPCGMINLSNIISYGRGTLPNLIENFGNDGYVSDAAEVEQSYNTEMPALKEKYSLADANTVNKMEYFAEAFRLNHEDPEGLKATAPIIYDYVNQIIVRI